ncbi:MULTISPECIES: TspO/MBR family protein [unclassified Chelatococcus]|uniref:TspO/MBR family protein n=1 Tax=unclassified Chelatococcus TaxID=2638111 RepID=UPI0002F6D4D8|nr:MULTISPECIES: TspO/MBR family protein [unclassified Chelatococcus]ALA17740.1 CrtK [Chelatococcus sp. CO-6]
MDASSWLPLVGFVAACLLAAMTGAFFRPGEWYERLKKPAWRPPNRLFAPVWTVLYLMIAVSGWLVWREAGFAGAALPLAVYALQLLLNAAWTPLFFGLHRPDLGFVDIVLLWLSIVTTIMLFVSISVGAALLLVPYLAWVTFATALNFAVWRLNPSASSPS